MNTRFCRRIGRLKENPALGHWSSLRMGDVFAGLDVAATIPPDMPVSDLLARIARTGTRKFLVVDDHQLVGVVTLANLIGHLHATDDAHQPHYW